MTSEQQSAQKHENRLQECEEKLRLVTGVLVQQDRIIQKLQEKLTLNDQRRMKTNILLSGLEEM